MFYDGGSAAGKALAESVQQSLNSMEECVKKSSALTGDYYMLKCTESPSVIVECGFMSNADDDRLLATAEYQKKIAFAVFSGAAAFLGL